MKKMMTSEDKQLLFKDLCARLPYGVKVHITNEWFYDKIEPYDRRLDCDVIRSIRVNEYTVKPYLRPMSSMTDDEKLKYITLTHYNTDDEGKPYRELTLDALDWLNEHHFDYRELIPMGLAIEAPEGMYE